MKDAGYVYCVMCDGRIKYHREWGEWVHFPSLDHWCYSLSASVATPPAA